MAKENRAFYYAPGMFPPKPERLLELVEFFSHSGYSPLIIDWGGLFPWSIDERFQNPMAYTEQVICELSARLKRLGTEHVPVLPAGPNMSCFLSLPAYRFLRWDDDDPDILDPAAPGAAKFVCDLLDDIVALLPDLRSIFLHITGPQRTTSGEGYPAAYAHRLLPKIVEEAKQREIRVVVPEPYFQGFEEPAATDLPGVFDMFGETDRESPVSLRDLESWDAALPDSPELFLDRLGMRAGVGASDKIAVRAYELRADFSDFCGVLDNGWLTARAAREAAIPSPALGSSPARACRRMKRAAAELEADISRLEEIGARLHARILRYTDESVITGWLRSRIEPLLEEAVVLASRLRQMELWAG